MFSFLSSIFVEELRKTWTKYVRIAGILAEIWARDLPSNMMSERRIQVSNMKGIYTVVWDSTKSYVSLGVLMSHVYK